MDFLVIFDNLEFQENLILTLIPQAGMVIMLLVLIKFIMPNLLTMIGKKQWGLEDRVSNCSCERCRSDKKLQRKLAKNRFTLLRRIKWDQRRDR